MYHQTVSNLGRFPFGASVLPCGAGLPGRSDAFVLGAYPSAVHVRWVPPSATGLKPISALAVDNEPAAFWDGRDADERVHAWKQRHFDPCWGDVTTARLNGPSGSWLQTNVLDPLSSAGADRQFVTDCLTTYRLSSGAATRLKDTYQQMAVGTAGLLSADLQGHPSEVQIVREALETQADRLARQIATARPSVIVTLGNAASRVVHALSGAPGMGTLKADSYGRLRTVTVSGLRASWIALVHPATPARWQARHQEWLNGPGFTF